VEGTNEAIGEASAASDAEGSIGGGLDAGPAPAGDPASPSQPTATRTAPASVASRITGRRERPEEPARRMPAGRVTGRAMLMRRYRGQLTRRFLLEVTMLRSCTLRRVATRAFAHTLVRSGSRPREAAAFGAARNAA
jgi:hypothetical protein